MRRKRTRRYQSGCLRLSPDGRRWLVKFYYAPGKQTTRTIGQKSQISRKQAELIRDEIVRPFNLNPHHNRGEETFQRFVEETFLPMKVEVGDWRENTAKECTREIRTHLITTIGDLRFADLTPAVPRAVLKTKAEQGLGRQVLTHLRGYLSDICRLATAEGYLTNNIAEGLKAPVKLTRNAKPKPFVTLDQYARAWSLLEERERLCFDLVMFAGMRESEAFALWCGDVGDHGIRIERSFYKGRYGAPKTPKSERMVGVPEEILQRLKHWISGLPNQGPEDCVFPSANLVNPMWPESMLRLYVRPRLRPADLGWINLAVLRRSNSTLHKQRNSDLKITADQQGHGMRTHLDAYVLSGVAERKAEAAKFYADFAGVLNNRG